MIRAISLTAVIVLLSGCEQAGNTANSFGLVWVGPGTSATLTINAQTTTTPTAPATVPVTVLKSN